MGVRECQILLPESFATTVLMPNGSFGNSCGFLRTKAATFGAKFLLRALWQILPAIHASSSWNSMVANTTVKRLNLPISIEPRDFGNMAIA